MAVSARRLRSLKSAYESAHERAFEPSKRLMPPAAVHPARNQDTPSGTITTTKSRIEVLDERFRDAVQREFTKLGLS